MVFHFTYQYECLIYLNSSRLNHFPTLDTFEFDLPFFVLAQLISFATSLKKWFSSAKDITIIAFHPLPDLAESPPYLFREDDLPLSQQFLIPHEGIGTEHQTARGDKQHHETDQRMDKTGQ